MNIVITGAGGFVGKNVLTTLQNIQNGNDKTRPELKVDCIGCIYSDTSNEEVRTLLLAADFVIHLAGVNRPQDPFEFTSGNKSLTESITRILSEAGKECPVLITSSTQAALDNPYGVSKRQAEEAVFAYGETTGADVFVYRLPNVFGKWCRPNYNSAVATFCHNIAHDLPIMVNDRNVELTLVYIDDVIAEILDALENKPHRDNPYCKVPTTHKVTLGEIVDALYSFKASRIDRSVPNMGDEFTKKLYATYLSYLPKDSFGYDLMMNVNARGSFTEILRTPDRGQFSVNISKPHITKGQHWHHTKNEKFLVVSGSGVIRFRSAEPTGSDEVLEYFVSGEQLRVIDIPTGYTHNIENLCDTDLVTFMWANECFDPTKLDTFFLEV